MPRKPIVNPRLGNDQVLPSEISKGQMLRGPNMSATPKPRSEFTDQARVNKLYRWK